MYLHYDYYYVLTVYLQSYAGKYVPAIGYKIHMENSNNPSIFINLKGLAIGDGLCDPENVCFNMLYNIYLSKVCGKSIRGLGNGHQKRGMVTHTL